MGKNQFNYSRHAEQAGDYMHRIIDMEGRIKRLKRRLLDFQKRAAKEKSDLEAAGFLNTQMAGLMGEIQKLEEERQNIIVKMEEAVGSHLAGEEYLSAFESDHLN